MQFSYRLSGTIEVPDGSTLDDDGRIQLPDGARLLIWESVELFHPETEEYEDISFDECNDRGILYDGDCCEFEPCYGTDDIAKLNAELAPSEGETE